jgi:hypothetical protein
MKARQVFHPIFWPWDHCKTIPIIFLKKNVMLLVTLGCSILKFRLLNELLNLCEGFKVLKIPFVVKWMDAVAVPLSHHPLKFSINICFL